MRETSATLASVSPAGFPSCLTFARRDEVSCAGFSCERLIDALSEAEAVAKGTRCRQFLFSLSLNPPPGEDVSIDTFETAIEMVEERLGLTGLPRAVVFHEKEGRLSTAQ